VNPIFTINFRREAYAQEVSRRRRRIISLGVWVAYFGLLSVVIGLYGLNSTALLRRSQMLQRQTTLIRRSATPALDAKLGPTELGQVEDYARSTRVWRDRLERLGELLPADARLTGLKVNPQNMSDADARNTLMISGEMRSAPGQDRMQGVMKIVSALRADSAFGRSFQNIKLASTRVAEGGSAQFEIECR
jgi:hypothetical protein